MSASKSVCKDELSVAYQEFLNTFADLELLKSAVRDNTRDQIRKSLETEERFQIAGRDDPTRSHYNMCFRSFSDGKHVFYSKRSRGPDGIREDLHIHKNRQFQWILAEAYEAFEDFIDFCYACGQLIEPGLWKSDQLRKVSGADSAVALSLENLLEAAGDTRKTGDAFGKLGRFRSSFPDLARVEQNFQGGCNPKVLLALVEQLRHVIVHCGGRVISRSKFETRVLGKCGLSSSGKNNPHPIDEIRYYLADYKGKCIVLMIEAPHPERAIFYTCRVGVLMEMLLAYGDFIYKELLLPRLT